MQRGQRCQIIVRDSTLCSSQKTAFQNNKYSLLLCKKLSFFLSENSRVVCKYKAKVAMRAMEGTVQEGNTLTWMEVVFVATFF